MPRSPIRITHVIPQIGIGGAELQLLKLIISTPPERARHRVLYYSDSLDVEAIRLYRESGADLVRVPRSGGAPLLFLRLAGEIRAGRPDIVHCWLSSAALWGRWAGTLAGAPRIVLSFRNSQIDFTRLLALSRRLDGRRVRYLANSSAVAGSIAGSVGADISRITVIPNGIDLTPPASAIAREALLREYRCPPDAKISLTVGRLSDQKNYPMLLRLAARCRGVVPVHFFVAGHGERETDLRESAVRMGVDDVVHFLGLRHDIPSLLRTADVFCYTTRYEGFPNALLEAMAAGCPIVTTDFAGVEDMVEHGSNALVVGQDDDERVFAALRTLLDDPARAAALGAAAHRTAEDRFSMARMVDTTLGYYQQMMEGAR